MCRLLRTLASAALSGGALLAFDSSPSSAAPASLGPNLIINGDAEAGPGSGSGNDVEAIPGWFTTSNFTVVQYGAPAFPTSAVSTAIGGGANFFAGGPDTFFSSAATQAMNVSALASSIDAGSDLITLSGFLGGFDGQDDDMTVTATFLNGSSISLGMLTIGPLLSQTGMARPPCCFAPSAAKSLRELDLSLSRWMRPVLRGLTTTDMRTICRLS